MSPAQEKKLFKLLQIKLNEFRQIFNLSKEEIYSKLAITTTKKLPSLEMSNLVKRLQNTINLAFKIGFLKIYLIQNFVKIKIAKFQILNTFFFKLKFKKLNIYNKNGKISRVLYSRRF